MKVVFVDIDGVLNSSRYRREKGWISVNIEPRLLMHLRTIVGATGAMIVLSTSWRKFWTKGGSVDSAGQAIDEALGSVGLSAWDKTPVLDVSRSEEVEQWMAKKGFMEYAILDDADGWSEKLYPHWIRCEDGLTEELAKQAIDVLNGKLLPMRAEESPAEQKKNRRTLLDRLFHRH